MFPSLHFARRFTAGLTISLCAFSFLGQALSTEASTVLSTGKKAFSFEESQITQSESSSVLLAHHEAAGLGTAQLITTGAQVTAGSASLSDSLWGNLILNMAYQRDVELQKIIKKLGRVSFLTLSGVAAISGLGLASSIDSLATLQDEPHPTHPVVLSLVGNGLSILSIGSMAYLNHHYKKEIQERQLLIKEKAEHILAHLKSGGALGPIQSDLTSLVGVTAAQEFLELWQVVHPKP